MNTGSEADTTEIRQFLRDFRNEIGFDFKSESGLLPKVIKKVIKRGEITNESEYFLLKEFGVNADHNYLKASDLSSIADMLHDFEEK